MPMRFGWCVATRAATPLGLDHGAQQPHDLLAGSESSWPVSLSATSTWGCRPRLGDRHPLLAATGRLTTRPAAAWRARPGRHGLPTFSAADRIGLCSTELVDLHETIAYRTRTSAY
jgi:hypothetical protein